ncbi:hypothetical protein V8C86DRAFT_1215523 [Haematococcus lacustris]
MRGSSSVAWSQGRSFACMTIAVASLSVLVLVVVFTGGRAATLLPSLAPSTFSLPHASHDLNLTNWNDTLGALPDDQWCLVEFYAGWCPHCREFAPTYDRVAHFLQRHGAPQPPGSNGSIASSQLGTYVFVGRVDCATEPLLCQRFSVAFYPSMTAGQAGTYRRAGNVTLYPAAQQRTEAAIVRWVGQLMNKTLKYTPPVTDPPAAAAAAAGGSSPGHQARLHDPAHLVWHVRDVEGATLQLWAMMTAAGGQLLRGPGKRQAMLDLVRWWAAGHASSRCQAGAQKLVAFASVLWPEPADPGGLGASSPPPDAILQYKICGPHAPEWVDRPESWRACRGSVPGSRGFTCGLWLLFHTSAARLPTSSRAAASGLAPTADQATLHATIPGAAQVMVTALRAFASHFFLCEVCQKHFSQILAQPEVDALVTQKEAVMWLWHTHNKVNARLAAQEAHSGVSASGDPAHPKRPWPSRLACPACWGGPAAPLQGLPRAEATAGHHRGVGGGGGGRERGSQGQVAWEEEAVYQYLSRVFGAEPRQGWPDEGEPGQLRGGGRRSLLVPPAHILAVQRGMKSTAVRGSSRQLGFRETVNDLGLEGEAVAGAGPRFWLWVAMWAGAVLVALVALLRALPRRQLPQPNNLWDCEGLRPLRGTAAQHMARVAGGGALAGIAGRVSAAARRPLAVAM